MKTHSLLIVALASAALLHGGPAASAGGFGHVEFANSGAPAAQADFLQGLALLHDFEYPSAAAAFRRAEAADPAFAMAYWGEAMTFNHPIWMQQDLESARAALAKLAPTPEARRAKAKTEREKAYLDAVEILYGSGSKQERDSRYEEAMARLHGRFPDDVNAAAFYGLSILGTAHAGRDIPTYMRAAGVLEEAWVDHREHPGLVHYLIHCYDDPAHAPLGLRAARIYARIAPDAGHAQHMTSHIFLALGMWPECVDANLAAIAAVDRMHRAEGKGPLCCGHYPSWLGYAYLQLGKTDEARRAMDTCGSDLEAHSADDHPGDAMDPDDSRSGSYANMRLRYLIDTGDRAGAEALGSVPTSAGPGGRLDLAFARLLAELGQRHRDEAKHALGELEAVGREVTEIETRRADPDPTYRIRPQVFLLEGRGLLAEQEGDLPGAEKLLRQAVALEETLPIAFGPPTIDKPTHELLGEYLLRHDRADEARAEFRKALARTPRRRLAEQGLAAATAALQKGHGGG
jgi:tetratricopeptide (TPR) repeat protein